MEIRLVLFRLLDCFLRFEQDNGLELDSVFRRRFLFVLAQYQRLQDSLIRVHVGSDDDDIFGIAVVSELSQVITIDHLAAVFFDNPIVCVVVRRGELQQQILFVLLEDALDGILPTFEILFVL